MLEIILWALVVVAFALLTGACFKIVERVRLRRARRCEVIPIDGYRGRLPKRAATHRR